MGKLPAIMLYDGDWVKDAVSGCSLAAQGLWLRMMFIGHNSERYGYLQQDGKPIPSVSIARRCGCSLDEYLALMLELDAAKVPSRTPDGIIFSRRMVRDGAKRAADAVRQERKRQKDCHASVTRPVTPLSVNENEIGIEHPVSEKPIQLVRFEVEDFDADKHFDHLCSVYRKAERSYSSESLFLEGVEWLVKHRTLNRSEAAGFIIGQAEAYCAMVPNGYQKGLTNWLRDKVFLQDRSVWERKEGGSGNTEQLVKRILDGCD